MVQYASELLQQHMANNIHNNSSSSFISTSSLTTYLLSWISTYLDNNDAWMWNLRYVGAVTSVILALIRSGLDKKGGIYWYPLVHAIFSSTGAFAVYYLNEFAAQDLTGTAEPLRSLECQGPLTSLHRVLPGITVGFAVLDLVDGMITSSVDFIVHGLATLIVMMYFVEINATHIIAPMLILEGSTIPLNLVYATCLPKKVTVACQYMFIISFFLIRIVLYPYMHWQLMNTLWQQLDQTSYETCFPPSFFWVCLMFGLVFHCLNGFWFYKIIKKLQRMLSGKQKEPRHLKKE